MYKKNHIHFVGIGGVGMSGIAEVLVNLGYPVSGSDLKSTETTRRLKKRGARIHYGHKAENIGETDIVVISSAIKVGNPELKAAREKGLPVIQRAEMLSELMRFSKYGIAVAGTHGKTTTTSLTANVLYEAGQDPTMIIGGKVNRFRSNARLGKGDFMVAEADESDGSFLKLSPCIEVITSIDREHMEYYGDFENVIQTYLEFTKRMPFYGVLICCVDHPVIKTFIPRVEKRVVTYGLSEDAQISARNLVFEGAKTSYDLVIHGEKKGRMTLNLAGVHNVQNSLAAIGVAQELSIPLVKVQKAFKNFQGIQRRCTVLLKNEKVTVIDDYGHHPEEIRVTLKAIRGAFQGRLVTFFQPHRYTRTHDLFPDFVTAFEAADVLLMTDIYAAGETPIEGVNSKTLVDAISNQNAGKSAHYLPNRNGLLDEVIAHLQPGDVLVTLGAGDITKMGKELVKKLKKGSHPAT